MKKSSTALGSGKFLECTPNPKLQNNVGDEEKAANELCEKMAKDSVMIVLQCFPKKREELVKLKKEFDWSRIFEIDPEIAKWIGTYGKTITKNILSQSQKDTETCFQNCSSKPFMFDPIVKLASVTMIETNLEIHRMIQRLKPFVLELLQMSTKISFAFDILAPKIQDGHNFGVSVQFKAIDNITEIYTFSFNQLCSFNNYYHQRALALQQMMVNPQVEDLQKCLVELDRDQYYSLCRICSQLYNSYTAMHDFVVKNLDKLLKPRD